VRAELNTKNNHDQPQLALRCGGDGWKEPAPVPSISSGGHENNKAEEPSSWEVVMNSESRPDLELPSNDAERQQHECREQERREPPRIYVASLSDYNNGFLHGEWLDADQDLDDLNSAITVMLGRSPSDPHAEEFAVHDSDGFGALAIGEYDPLEWINTVARGISEHGPAFSAWAAQCQGETERLADFEEAYLGEWDSLSAYAEDLLDDLGYIDLIDKAVPKSLQPYVKLDYEAFARDLRLSGDITVVARPEGGVWLYHGDLG
jgi:antirestriction protein